jgi:hypothetical protein
MPPYAEGGSGVQVKPLPQELARLEQGRHEILLLRFGEKWEYSDKAQAIALFFNERNALMF